MKVSFKKFPTNLLLIFTILVIYIVVTAHFIYSKGKERIKKEKQEDMLIIAELKANQIEQWLNERLRDAMIIQNINFISEKVYEFFKNPKREDLKNELKSWMDSFKKTYEYKAILLVNEKMDLMLYSSDDKELLGPDAKRLSITALNSKRIQLSDIYRSKITNAIRLTVAVPLLVEKGRDTLTIGVCMLRIDPDKLFYTFLYTWPIKSDTAETLLVRRENNEVLFLNELRHKKDSALILKQPIGNDRYITSIAGRGIEGATEGLDYRGVYVLAGIKKVPNTTWYLITKIDAHEAYKPVRLYLWSVVVITSLLIITIGFAFMVIWRHQRAKYYKELYKQELKQRAFLRHFEYLTKYANDIIILVDKDLNIIEANDRAIEYYEYSEDELKWMKLNELYPEERKEELKDIIERIVKEGGLIYEAMQINKSKKTFIAEISARFFDIEGNRFFQFIIRDITERKKMEEELRNYRENLERLIEQKTSELSIANKELEAFSYSVSHDLRAPLRSVDGFSQALIEDYFDKLDDTGKDYLRRIRGAAKRMEELIDDLLNLSRITRKELSIEEVDLSSLAKEIIDTQIQKGANVKVLIHENMNVKGDPHLLRIMLENLFSNALKFTSKSLKPEIEFGMTEIDGKLTYFVRDNGIGFDMRFVDKLFKPFQRLHSLKEFPGTGIGLAIVYRVVKRHGGDVWAEAEIGKGATFYFRL